LAFVIETKMMRDLEGQRAEPVSSFGAASQASPPVPFGCTTSDPVGRCFRKYLASSGNELIHEKQGSENWSSSDFYFGIAASCRV
jgi:hypothetical protein